LLIEADQNKILFDTGQGIALPENARAMGVDVSKIRSIVLSHGHYDHTGGLPFVLKDAKAAEIFFHPDIYLDRYSLKPGNIMTPISMPESARQALQNHAVEKIHAITSCLEIFPGVFITGPIPRKTQYEDTGGAFYCDQESKQPDGILDDQSLWLETEQGLIVITGCCHSGLENTMEYIFSHSRGKKVRAVIGGFHLLNAGKHRMIRTLDYLRSIHFGQLYPCHCTGENALSELKHAFGDRVEACKAGMRIVMV
jgi:7,8-dihydropterin-6-yl-methyl-4-(beta-D-ribofuranosyl)aminobenzene 5'-phosphate synthase